MAVEFFLIDAPHTVPVEHAAWQEALARWHIAADRLEQVARAAWINVAKPRSTGSV